MRHDEAMGTLRRGIAGAFAVAMLALAVAAAPAAAADTITADLSCCTFGAGPYFQDLGEVPVFDNPVAADAPHNVTAVAFGPDGGRLFRSRTIAAGDTTPVSGTQFLGAGDYPFFCTLHGASMSGTLTVDGSKGTVAPRPSIRVWIPSQRLRWVRRSGRLKVKVRVLTGSVGIRLLARRGKRTIGSVSNIRMAEGSTRTVTVRLSRAGRRAVSRGRKQAISVRGTVAFGRPGAARKTIR